MRMGRGRRRQHQKLLLAPEWSVASFSSPDWLLFPTRWGCGESSQSLQVFHWAWLDLLYHHQSGSSCGQNCLPSKEIMRVDNAWTRSQVWMQIAPCCHPCHQGEEGIDSCQQGLEVEPKKRLLWKRTDPVKKGCAWQELGGGLAFLFVSFWIPVVSGWGGLSQLTWKAKSAQSWWSTI